MVKEFSAAGLDRFGFSYDQVTNVWFGLYAAYPLYIAEHYYGEYTLVCAIAQGGKKPDSALTDLLEQSSGGLITQVTATGYELSTLVKLDPKQEEAADKLAAVLALLTDFLKTKGWQPVCQDSAQTEKIGIYTVDGEIAILSEAAYQARTAAIQAKLEQPERVGFGALGACLGALLTGGLSLYLAHLGYVIWFMGFLLGFALVLGYKLLGRKVSVKSLLVLAPILLISLTLINELDFVTFFIRSRGWSSIVKFYKEIRLQIGFTDPLYWQPLLNMAWGSLAAAALTFWLCWRSSRRQVDLRQLFPKN